ncbi:MAG: hypothetical protein JRD93_17595 [Deltaproteobacteria bacterium]|nr:hypothetical protein [Deltaproteobacteria bacterium]
MIKDQKSIKEQRKQIIEMIDASWELAQRLGEHSLKTGCNCISCVNKRKRILKKQKMKWKFNL